MTTNKTNSAEKALSGFFTSIIKTVLLLVVLAGCSTDPVLWETRSNQLVITQYIENDPEFSEFAGLLESTGLNSLLSVRGPYTLFLPSNNEMLEYYSEKGISSYLDLSDDQQEELVLNHLIGFYIETGDIGLGALTETNGIGDFIVSEFHGSEIILNKNSKIIKRDILTSNGVIHHIDKVLDPVTKSVYELLEDNPDYSIFTEGIKLTQLSDTLNTITFPYGDKIARCRFTVLAISDTTFNRFGIFNINDLVNYFTDKPDSVAFINNEFYRYMEYHCLAETYYLNNLETNLFPILSYDNNIFITVSDDYKINLKNDVYTGFYLDQSNLPGKNGTIHTVNDLMPVFEPSPTTIMWETTDHFDMRQGDYYLHHYKRWYDGQNTFANIKWDGDYMLYYYKLNTLGWNLNADCLSMSGWWWIEVTTPKIMKGKYEITGNTWGGNGKGEFDVIIDGEATANIKQSDPTLTTSWGIVDWTTTETHKIKLKATSPGMLFWDRLIFTPVN